MKFFLSLTLALAVLSPRLVAAPANSGPAGIIEKAQQLIAAGRLKDAIRLLGQVDSSTNQDARLPFLKAWCAVRQWPAKPDKAEQEQVLKLIGRSRLLDPTFGGSYFVEGLACFILKDYANAARSFESALAREYRPLVCRQNLVQCLFRQGLAVADDGDAGRQEALRIFGDLEKRLDALRQDLRYLPGQRQAFYDLWLKTLVNLAALNQQASNLAKAHKILLRLVALQPDNPLHSYHLGLFEGRAHHWDSALKWYGRAMAAARKTAPNFLEPLLKMGWIYSQRGENAKAERAMKTYIEHYPKAWYGHFYLGQHYENAGQLAQAIAEFEKCRKISPTSYVALGHLHNVLLRAGHAEEAKKVLAVKKRLEAEYAAKEKEGTAKQKDDKETAAKKAAAKKTTTTKKKATGEGERKEPGVERGMPREKGAPTKLVDAGAKDPVSGAFPISIDLSGIPPAPLPTPERKAKGKKEFPFWGFGVLSILLLVAAAGFVRQARKARGRES